MRAPSRLFIEVVGGIDHGTRLVLDRSVKTIGRSHDANLVLRDPAVSRSHAQVLALESGVQFAVCSGAAPALVDGRPALSFEAKSGERIALGKTMLVVGTLGASDPTPEGDIGETNARTLMTGIAADARLLTAVHEVLVALDRARDRAELAEALQTWAAAHVRATQTNVTEGSLGAAAGNSGEAMSYCVEPAGSSGE